MTNADSERYFTMCLTQRESPTAIPRRLGCMAANPALSTVSHAGQATQLPALYAQEVIALQRDGIDFSINGLRHQSGK